MTIPQILFVGFLVAMGVFGFVWGFRSVRKGQKR